MTHGIKDKINLLIQEGYNDHYNSIDAEVLDEMTYEEKHCVRCDSLIVYKGLLKDKSYRAFMVCPKCGWGYEF